MKRILCIAVTAALFCALFTAAAAGVPDAAIAVRDGVVRVLSEDSEYTYSGSAFVLSSDGAGTYVATNYHVVDGSDPSTIRVLDHKGTKTAADIEFYSENYDLCVLKTAKPLSGVTPVSLYPAGDIPVGNDVYALGFPAAGDSLLDSLGYKVEDITVTNGIVSAIKTVTAGSGKLTLVQMNADINPGSSGGPLVNAKGQVVGVDTLGIEDSSGVFAAVSIRHLLTLLDSNHIAYRTLAAAEQSGSALVVLLVVLGVVVVLAGALVLILTLRKKRRATLACRMELRLQGHTPGEALSLMGPALRSLINLHSAGRAHGAIYPANLFVDRAGRVYLGKGGIHPEPIPEAKPYLAMELYSEQSAASPASDVYALAAVLYYMITCREPDEVPQRLESDTLPASLKRLYDAAGPVSGALGRGMALDPGERIPNAYILAGELSAAVAATRTVAPIPAPQMQSSATPATMSVPSAAEIAPAQTAEEATAPQLQQTEAIVPAAEIPPADAPFTETPAAPAAPIEPAVLPLASQASGRSAAVSQPPSPKYAPSPQPTPAPAYYTSPGTAQPAYAPPPQAYAPPPAAKVPKKKRRSGLIIALSAAGAVLLAVGGLVIYNEIRYNDAVRLVEAGDYDGAKSAVDSIFPFYRDADTLTKYIRAKARLAGNDYSGAKTAFEALGDYRDSKLMITECDYQEAFDLYITFEGTGLSDRTVEDAQNILDKFDALGTFGDVAERKADMEDVILETGVSYLQMASDKYLQSDSYQSDFYDCVDSAKSFFELSTSKDASRYRDMCTALYTKNIETIYNWLTANKDLKVANSMRYSEVLVDYVLLGNWSGDGVRFVLNKQGATTDIVSFKGVYSIEKDGDTYNWMISTDGGSNYFLAYTFTFTDDNTFVAKVNGASYTLHRQ